ncbi:cathepsin L [Patella vulgata]|uniref:cathepsin L n=1 Tax=Patella vulgata TaxID=6465 RepID=UPI0021808DC8|nr:cathepsin L [Patella vulgata]
MAVLPVIFILLLVSLSNGEYPTTDDEVQEMFRFWMIEHDKIYPNEQEENKSYRTFKDNIQYINQLNTLYRGRTGFGINQFADLSPKEFQKKILMPKRQAPVFDSKKYVNIKASAPLPDSYDWRDKNMVTSVKDQGSVGTCWAFSTVGNIESQWALQGKSLSNFSVEQVVDCDGTEDVKLNKADCGVFGGWPFLAYEYVKRQGGLESWNDYAYCSGTGKCFTCPAQGYNKTLCGPPVEYCQKNESCDAKLDKSKFVPGLKVDDWQAVDQDETTIAHGLMLLGPLSVALDASLLQFYKFGVFSPITCNPKLLDHAVLMVGFGVEKTLFGSKPYWMIKNSWGEKWGEKGYFKIKRGSGTCGINTQVTTAILAK